MSAVPGKQNSKGGVSQAIRLRDVLEDEIVNGELKPGDRLDEAALAERFGVSRTPIREAFKYLVGSGLVETIPNRGSFVASVGLPQLIDSVHNEQMRFILILDPAIAADYPIFNDGKQVQLL